MRDDCLDAICEFFLELEDVPGMKRVDLYYAEYETRLLGNLTEGRDECGVRKPPLQRSR